MAGLKPLLPDFGIHRRLEIQRKNTIATLARPESFLEAISTTHSLPLAEISELSRSGKAIGGSGPIENNQPSINQIIFEDIKQTTEVPVLVLEEDNSSGTDDFPNRRGFFTGHRIPLELFPQDTLRRIELTSGMGH